ncbi:DUF5994 family protein [Amycolatopsis sp.]|uniref:DUF5994 family protein n=1 Tax=Amycolatopsis sp. TaxID=37632 RepID=UPI002D7E61A6|nr:DUF5994 family protein [Amycolatopsis sp.]HET6705046.1 DUF5994 family protein [Amycolatopsis sp.]
MTPESPTRTRTSSARPGQGTHPLPRLVWKPQGGPAGHVDGGWWPWSRDLAAELPGLAAALTARMGYPTRVAYTVSEWDSAPRRLEIDGQVIRLDGLLDRDGHILSVTGPEPNHLTLLVIPPQAADTAGHRALMTASRRGNTDRPADILAASGALVPPAATRSRPDTTEDSWETEGGHVS